MNIQKIPNPEGLDREQCEYIEDIDVVRSTSLVNLKHSEINLSQELRLDAEKITKKQKDILKNRIRIKAESQSERTYEELRPGGNASEREKVCKSNGFFICI